MDITGSLMGYGYTGLNESESNTLQRMTLEITRYFNGTSEMVEAVSFRDEARACHGDSGPFPG